MFREDSEQEMKKILTEKIDGLLRLMKRNCKKMGYATTECKCTHNLRDSGHLPLSALVYSLSWLKLKKNLPNLYKYLSLRYNVNNFLSWKILKKTSVGRKQWLKKFP